MCYSDIFATMALAAEHSRTSVLGTFVLCAGNRAAPVSASALATINELAPGRAIAGWKRLQRAQRHGDAGHAT